MLKWDESEESEDDVLDVMHELVHNCCQIKDGGSVLIACFVSQWEMSKNGDLIITVNVTEDHFHASMLTTNAPKDDYNLRTN